MKRALVAATLIATLAAQVHADALVMRTEVQGRVDKQASAQIEGAVLALAKSAGAASAGDITYAEAAVTVGCKPEDASCKDEVLGLLGVDEVVTIAAAPKRGGVEITVRRITKGGWTRTATTLAPTGKLDQLDALAPLFGGQPAALAPAPAPVAPTPAPTPTPAVTTSPTPVPVAPAEPQPVPPPTAVAEPAPSVVVTPPAGEPVRDDRGGSNRLPKIGMVAGGTIAAIGLVFWASAASKSAEIDGLPTRTRADLLKIMQLEDDADGYAATGNVLVLAGVVVGGVSAYYYVKGRRAQRAMTARITPAIFGDGAGIAVTIGGSP